MKHELPSLSYALDALQPVISAEALGLHHGKHHKTYVDKLNEALSKVSQYQDWTVEHLLTDLDSIDPSVRTAIRNHGGGHHNHSSVQATPSKVVQKEAMVDAAATIPAARIILAINGRLLRLVMKMPTGR